MSAPVVLVLQLGAQGGGAPRARALAILPETKDAFFGVFGITP